jgi:hypothetical protein
MRIKGLADDGTEDLLAAPLRDELRGWLGDGGPDEAIGGLRRRIGNGQPSFRPR